MGTYYILDGKTPVEASSIHQWAIWFESADRVVRKTAVNGDVEISTVFLGLGHQFGDGSPLLFETLVLGGELDGDMWHYSTWHEAEEGHNEVVTRCREMVGVPAGVVASEPQ